MLPHPTHAPSLPRCCRNVATAVLMVVGRLATAKKRRNKRKMTKEAKVDRATCRGIIAGNYRLHDVITRLLRLCVALIIADDCTTDRRAARDHGVGRGRIPPSPVGHSPVTAQHHSQGAVEYSVGHSPAPQCLPLSPLPKTNPTCTPRPGGRVRRTSSRFPVN